jgi:hypothetical protein
MPEGRKTKRRADVLQLSAVGRKKRKKDKGKRKSARLKRNAVASAVLPKKRRLSESGREC